MISNSHDACLKVKRSRKPRVIKNGIVDIDNVSIGRGVGNVNWLKIAKYKLQQRELILMQQRQNRCVNIIISSIRHFTEELRIQNENIFKCADCKTSADLGISHLYRLYEQEVGNKVSNLVCRFTESITSILSKWNGYSTEKEIVSFRKYFQGARRWFDIKKIAVMALEFWIPFMRLIQELGAQAATQFRFACDKCDLETLYRDYFVALILTGLCEGEIKPANTKNVWLIPAMTYSIFVSKYNQYLQISIDHRLIEARKNKIIRKKYLQCMRTKKKKLGDSLQPKLLRFYHQTHANPPFDPFQNQPFAYDNPRFDQRNESPAPMPMPFQLPTFSECGAPLYHDAAEWKWNNGERETNQINQFRL